MRLFHLFGNPTRQVIFQRLARKPMSAGELAKTLPVSRSAVVQHLTLLKAAGLVDCRADGRRQVYRVLPSGLEPLRQWIAQQVSQPPTPQSRPSPRGQG
jgi:DNA-binding transcriptional ArsR family regulator